jgi:putative acetyltransferase
VKIQRVTEENYPRVYALLRSAFPYSEYEANLVQALHENGRPLHDWVCLQSNRIIAYLAFSNAYIHGEACGLHLAPMAVAPEYQGKGVGTELLTFALRQQEIKDRTLFVLGKPEYYQRFGFEPCQLPVCPFDSHNAHFLALRNSITSQTIVGYEPEFGVPAKPSKSAKSKPRRRR